MVRQYLASLLFLLALSPLAQAQITTPCTFQEYVCGSTLLTNGKSSFNSSLNPWVSSLLTLLCCCCCTGYVAADLRAGYAINPDNPVIADARLNQVLFRCIDQIGTIVGNSYCIVGCATIGTDIDNDMCTM